jgi:acyl carrier protein
MTHIQQITDWLSAWIRERGKAEGAALTGEANFLEEGWVDSVGVIQLICAAEEEFGIRFNEDHFADPAFPTVSGLAGIIETAQQQAAARPGPRR